MMIDNANLVHQYFKTLLPGVHKRKWDAESRSGAFLGSKNGAAEPKKRIAQRNLGIEIFLFLVAPLIENGKLILKIFV